MSNIIMGNIIDTFLKVFIDDDRWKLYLEGMGNTLFMSVLAIIIGIIIGLTVAVIKNINKNTGKLKTLNWLGDLYVNVIRGIPVMLQLFIIYFVILAGVNPPEIVAAIAFGINSGAYVAEIFRGGIMSVDKGQMEAGRSLGLSYGKTMYKVVVPQAMKNAIPPLGNEFIALIKETAIVGSLGIVDLTKVADGIKAATFEVFMPLMISAVFYLIIIGVLTKIMNIIERRLGKSDTRS